MSQAPGIYTQVVTAAYQRDDHTIVSQAPSALDGIIARRPVRAQAPVVVGRRVDYSVFYHTGTDWVTSLTSYLVPVINASSGISSEERARAIATLFSNVLGLQAADVEQFHGVKITRTPAPAALITAIEDGTLARGTQGWPASWPVVDTVLESSHASRVNYVGLLLWGMVHRPVESNIEAHTVRRLNAARNQLGDLAGDLFTVGVFPNEATWNAINDAGEQKVALRGSMVRHCCRMAHAGSSEEAEHLRGPVKLLENYGLGSMIRMMTLVIDLPAIVASIPTLASAAMELAPYVRAYQSQPEFERLFRKAYSGPLYLPLNGFDRMELAAIGVYYAKRRFPGMRMPDPAVNALLLSTFNASADAAKIGMDHANQRIEVAQVVGGGVN